MIAPMTLTKPNGDRVGFDAMDLCYVDEHEGVTIVTVMVSVLVQVVATSVTVSV